MNLHHLIGMLSAEQPQSGTALAAQLGVTRAAVWKHIMALRALGLPVQAHPTTGYRLQWPVELLDRERILAQLPPSLGQASPLAIHWQLASTNSELLSQAARGAADGCVCLAESQTAGRGRRGRHWISPFAGNIYFSLLKRFDCGIGALSGLSLAAGIALSRALIDCGVSQTGLKWPNDVLAQGRKLAGILIELGGEYLGPCFAVIGIGVNLHLGADGALKLEHQAIDLTELNGVPPGRNRLIGRLWLRLLEVCDQFAAEGFAALRKEYEQYDVLAGRTVRLTVANEVREGIAIGVDDRGALKVRHGDQIVAYDSAEITMVRI